MSTELEAYFTALRHDADELPTAAPDAARRRGQRRRRRAAVIAAVAVFLVVGTVAVAIGATLPKAQPQPAGTPTGTPAAPSAGPPTATPAAALTPTTFTKLAAVGPGIVFPAAHPLRFGTAVATGDRAYVCWQSETGQTSVAAVDLKTGRAAWGPVLLADFDDTAVVFWHPRYVLVIGSQDNGSEPDTTVFALDPGTGKVLLRVDVNSADDLVAGESTLVLGSRQDRETRGYDLATGQVRWTVADPPSRVVHSFGMLTAAGPPVESQRGEFTVPASVSSQFVQLAADGTAMLRDVATGAESARRTGAVGAVASGELDDMLAVDGVLYVVARQQPGVLRAVNLSGSPAPATLYTAAPGAELGRLLWCGAALICFAETSQDADRFVGFDPAGRTVRWQQDASADGLQVVNGMVLLNLRTRGGDQRSAVIDANGRQLLGEQAQAGAAGWIDELALLVLGTRRDGSGVDVAGVSPLTGKPVALGTVQDSRGCGWSRTHLICVTLAGVKVWRFAG